jgi:F-type H+-transporting ATPase subunit b
MSSENRAPRRIAPAGWLFIGLTALVLTVVAVDPALAAAAEKSAFQKYWALGWRLVNFLILVVILYKVAKDPAKKFFSDKRREAQETLDELNQAKETAQAELDVLKNKLRDADSEIDRLVEQLTEAASRNYDRIIREAGTQAEEIVTQAKVAAETELSRATEKLTAESGSMIVARAQEMLKEALTPEDHQHLIEENLAKMDSSKAA